MARLTPAEQKKLDELQTRADSPDVERAEVVNITIDLADAVSVRRAVALGYLDKAALADLDDEDEDNEDDDEDGKARKPRGLPSSRRKPAKPKPEADDEPADRRYG